VQIEDLIHAVSIFRSGRLIIARYSGITEVRDELVQILVDGVIGS
jgi:hypothetical protein